MRRLQADAVSAECGALSEQLGFQTQELLFSEITLISENDKLRQFICC